MSNFIQVTSSAPCLICGKPDWCFRMERQDGMGHYCARKDDGVVQSPVINEIFLAQYVTPGNFTFYEWEEDRKRSHEAFIDKLIAEGKLSRNYKKFHPEIGAYGGVDFSESRPSRTSGDLVIEDVMAGPDRLSEVYNAFLDLLELEDYDRDYLRGEWDNPDFPERAIFSELMKRWKIRSVPMDDGNRYNGGYRLKNKWRKAIMEQLVAKVGEPEGVPFFYYRPDKEEGEALLIWLKNLAKQRKTESEDNKAVIYASEILAHIKEGGKYDLSKWTFFSLSGIVFPVYDSKGRIVRLRIRDEHPLINGEFEGDQGTFAFANGGWVFKKLDPETKRLEYPGTVVFNPKEKINRIGLKPFTLPKGKSKGKYKNCSSYREKKDDDAKIVYNRYLAGTQSGSHISLYTKEGDNPQIVYVIEGEKKAMVANEIFGAPCISLPGVGTFSKLFQPEEGEEKSMADILIEKGMKVLILGYDADKAKNAAVLRAENNAVKTITDRGIHMMIAEWNGGIGKGLDDILIQGALPKFIPVK